MAKSFSQAGTDYITLSNDSSAANRTLGNSLMNMCIKDVLARSDWNFIKDSGTFTTGTSVQDYNSPHDANKIEYVTVTVGSIKYTPREIRDEKGWFTLNNVTITSDIPNFWYVSPRTRQISLFPIPSTRGNVIEIGWTKKVRDLGVADYSTGTVLLSLGSTTIAGGGSASWNAKMIGRSLSVQNTNTEADDFWFEIKDVIGTNIIITKEQSPATATTASGSYIIAETIPLPDGFENIPLWYALDSYYQMREKPTQAAWWEKKWKEGVDELERRDIRSVTGVLTKQTPLDMVDPNMNPYGIFLE